MHKLIKLNFNEVWEAEKSHICYIFNNFLQQFLTNDNWIKYPMEHGIRIDHATKVWEDFSVEKNKTKQ